MASAPGAFGLDPSRMFIQPFDGKNFLSWKFMVETVLKQGKCDKAITEPDITKVDADGLRTSK